MIGDIQFSRRKFGMLVSGATVAIAAAGCGMGASASPTNTKRLRIAVASEPTTVNLLRDSEATAELLAYNVYETLTKIGPDGKAAPLLAESWETVDKTFVVKLRTDVTFHDGSPLTAADVAASFTRAMGSKNNIVAGMSAAEARDEHTVVITTDTVNVEMPLLVSRMCIAPAKLAAGDELEDTMVGTGPYIFDRWDRGRQIEFRQNDKYWGTPATFENVTWTFTADSAVRANSLKAGEVDIAHDLSTDDAAQLPNVVSGPVSQVLCMRVKYAPGYPLGNPDIRMAAASALDLEAIIAGIYRGRASLPNGHAVISKVFGYDPALRDHAYDPAKAKALLEKAGAVGTTLTISTAQTRWDKSREIAQAIQDMLKQVGFDAPVSYDDESSWREKLFATGGGATEENLKSIPDLSFVVNGNVVFTSYGSLRVYSCKGEYPGGCDQEYSDTVIAAAAATDVAEKEKLYQKSWNLMHDHGLVFPVAALHQSHGVAENVDWKLSEIIPVYARDISFKS